MWVHADKSPGENKEIVIYKSEIEAVLGTGTFRTKQMAFAMLVTSKRYGRTFYLTQNTAMKMIGTKSAGTVWDAINRLEKAGYIESVRRGELDFAASRELGRAHRKPNKYKIMTEEPEEGEANISITKDADLIEVTKSLLTTDDIKRHVKRWEFDNRWRAEMTV